MRIAISIFGLAILVTGASAQCDKLPENIDIEGCCKFPDIVSDEVGIKIGMQFKDHIPDAMLTCKMAEAIFKELKLVKDNNVYKDAVLKYFETDFKDATWNPILKAAGEKCFNDLATKKDEIIKELENFPFNIKKDQCNALFLSFAACLHVTGFESCPKSSWTEEKKCTDAKAWIGKCGTPFEAMKVLVKELPAKLASA